MSLNVPASLIVVGAGLAVAAGWIAYRPLEGEPGAEDFTALAKRVMADRRRGRPSEPSSPPVVFRKSGSDSRPTFGNSATPGLRDRVISLPEVPGLERLIELPSIELAEYSKAKVVRGLAHGRDGMLYVAVSAPRIQTLCGFAETEAGGEIWVYDSKGKRTERRRISEFVPQAILASPVGELYVAGEGYVAIYSPAGELKARIMLESRKNYEVGRRIADENSANARAAALHGFEKRIADLQLAVREGENSPSVGDDSSARLKHDRDLLSALKDLLAHLLESTPDEERKATLATWLCVDRIEAYGDDLFTFSSRGIERYSLTDKERSGLLKPTGNWFADMRAVGRELYCRSNDDHQIQRYDHHGRLIGSIDLKFDDELKRYLGEPPPSFDYRAWFFGPFCAAGDDRLMMRDQRGSLIEWSKSGNWAKVAFARQGGDDLGPRAETDGRIEASFDGRRFYMSAVGSVRILQFARLTPGDLKL